MTARRVAVTGVGVVSALGDTFGEFWTGVASGASAIRPRTFTPPDALRFPNAAEAAHLAHVLLAIHRVNHGSRGEKEQALEKRVRHQVEDARGVGAHATSEKRAIIIAVNLDAHTLTVLGYDPVAIISEAADGTVGFAATDRGVVNGVTAGKLNRVTGLTSIDFKMNDDLRIFDGTCKRAEKLF